MLRSFNLVAFVATSDPERAKAFYRGTLGLHLLSEELPFALIFDVNGTTLRVSVVKEVTKVRYTVLGWAVPDIVTAAHDLQRAGVILERFEGLTQDAAGIWTAPSGARVAWFRDPDGNLLSVSQQPVTWPGPGDAGPAHDTRHVAMPGISEKKPSEELGWTVAR
jgi:catechol 2,3-dioxygenase-like lactoylglutathione lyase family enzyme